MVEIRVVVAFLLGLMVGGCSGTVVLALLIASRRGERLAASFERNSVDIPARRG